MLSKNRINLFILVILLIQLGLPSCASKKHINYFQSDETTDSILKLNVNHSYTPVFKADDFLYIEITALDLESIKPFALDPVSGGGQAPSYVNGMAAKSGYLINSQGDIDFPVIGKVHIAGMNRTEATELIKGKISEYIQNPVVNIRIQNFKVTVLGDVKNPGTFNIPNERITLPEALGIAGDLNMTGVRRNVMVIRDDNGVKTQYRVDLTSSSVFSSPVYYLAQNDVVYVEPNRAKRNSSLVSSTSGIFISVASLVITTITLITRK